MRQLLFSIEKLETIGGGNAIIGGRSCRDTIRIGDNATRSVMLETGEHELISRDILIRFRRISAYGESIDEIPPGMTAAIVVPALLAAELSLTWYLVGENPD